MPDPKLTEAMIEVGDCRTTLHYFSKAIAEPAMGFTDAAKYNALHESVSYGVDEVSEASSGPAPLALKKISAAYYANKYWFKATGLDDIATFPANAWQSILPLECTLKERIEIEPNGFTFKISPTPRVLLYPFGWTTKLSIRITKDHTLEQLAQFVQYLVKQPCIKISQAAPTPPIEPMSLTDFFRRVSAGVRADIFEGDKSDRGSRDAPIIVTTVIAKSGISPTSEPDEELRKLMLRIVTPDGDLPSSPFSEHVYSRNPDDTLQFVVSNNHGRFIWLESLLVNEGHQRARLLCHHNNSFLSLAHAVHLAELLESALQQRKKSKTPWSDSLMELLVEAENQLSEPRYKNASQKVFLQGVGDIITEFNALIGQSKEN